VWARQAVRLVDHEAGFTAPGACEHRQPEHARADDGPRLHDLCAIKQGARTQAVKESVRGWR
jgi:hypothetical protein